MIVKVTAERSPEKTQDLQKIVTDGCLLTGFPADLPVVSA